MTGTLFWCTLRTGIFGEEKQTHAVNKKRMMREKTGGLFYSWSTIVKIHVFSQGICIRVTVIPQGKLPSFFYGMKKIK